jgi:DNA-binding response OmpR family regulator
VVDDNESIRVFLRHFFNREGIPVEILDSPVQALELFRAEPQNFSMLLTDCEMPGMSGLELAHEVRRVRADLPMMIFSTSVTVLGPNRFLSQGFVAALPKPVALEHLRAAVRGILDPNYPARKSASAESAVSLVR